MAEKNDPYAHRKHRIKYKLGYGAEGAARGTNFVGGNAEGTDPRMESEAHDEAKEKEHTYEAKQQ